MFSEVVVPPGFEPGSRDPESRMMDHYTKGLASERVGFAISTNPTTKEATQSPRKAALIPAKSASLGRSSASLRADSGVSVRPISSSAVCILSS